MTSKSIEAPGIELREIDRSQEQKQDYSLPNAPTCLVTGVASKGEDYTLQWINSKATLDKTYGYPTNEPETWFYNAICEILNRGGTAIAAKLPYDNDALQKYAWRQWSVDNFVTSIDFKEENIRLEYIKDIYDKLDGVLRQLKRTDNIQTITKMWNVVKDIAEKEFGAKVESVEEEIDGTTYVFETLIFSDPSGTETKEFESTIAGCARALELVIKNLAINPYAALRLNDSNITSYIKIYDDRSGIADLDTLDKNLTYTKTLLRNKIRVYDITRSQYGEYDKANCVKSMVETDIAAQPIWTNDCLGIVPVLVTAPNAMYFQNLLETFDATVLSGVGIDETFNQLAVEKFNVLSTFGTLEDGSLTDTVSTYFDPVNLFGDWLTIPLSASDQNEETTSREAALAFPAINWEDDSHYERDYLKHIGVVVFKATKDLANDSRISFIPVEAFVGSLDRAARDKISHASIFIDDVVNSRSSYIRLFSNVDKRNLERASTLVVCNQRATSLGFHKIQCKKIVTKQKSIIDGLTKVLDQCKDPNTIPLDLVVDAGVSNLAQLLESAGTGKLDFEMYPRIADFGTQDSELVCKCGCTHGVYENARAWSLDSVADTRAWRQVLRKLDEFCKFTRKDCMLLADGLRTFCLEGDEKLVRRTKPSSSVESTILPKIRYMADAINSSYAAGWCNWFYMADAHTGDLFWCPPSIKMASICIYCDTYFHPWDAPAGMTRGIVPNVVDVAFNPTNDEAGKIYNHQWNYAVSYPLDGIIAEGQKTFQTAKTALDRVNVRRLMLNIEKDVVQIARRFLYEGNTSWLRQRFVDTITPVLENVVDGGGISEYAIKCDEELNTTKVIENHELRCKIAVKPVKTLEYIVLDFMCTRQGANISEEVLR